MAFITDLQAHVDTVRTVVGAGVDAAALPSLISRLSDTDVVALIEEASAVIRAAESLRVTASGVVAARSSRDAGRSGLSQVRGHGSPVSLVQKITGGTRADATRQVRAGEALLAGAVTADGSDADAGAGGAEDQGRPGAQQGGDVIASVPRVRHAAASAALLRGRLTTAQRDAILRNLGEPPTIDAESLLASLGAGNDDGAAETHGSVSGPSDGRVDVDMLLAAAHEEARRAWETAAAQLVDEAGCRTVEDLAAQARAIRDLLDPEGAQRRFQERFERRSFRSWTDHDGLVHGSFLFDDEGALWVRTILDTARAPAPALALAPRRGVRFVDPTDKERADLLTDDPRTTDQLAYDLMIDRLRAGALADAESVFGTRQAGVRIIVTGDTLDADRHGVPAVGATQDDSATLPGWLAAQRARDVGASECRLDRGGNPLDLGRESRLFSSKQKITLALRDGGCRWPGGDRPSHYGEAHHIDGWAAGGRTDIDRGILLCRFHRMQLHHGGWRITRNGKDDVVVHPSGGDDDHGAIVLTTRLARRCLFRTTPPNPRFRTGATVMNATMSTTAVSTAAVPTAAVPTAAVPIPTVPAAAVTTATTPDMTTLAAVM